MEKYTTLTEHFEAKVKKLENDCKKLRQDNQTLSNRVGALKGLENTNEILRRNTNKLESIIKSLKREKVLMQTR